MQDDEKELLGKLLANVCRIQGTKADRCFEELGIYRGQAILLKILSKKDGLTHSEIAKKLEISPAAATKVIKRLEHHNYLIRQPDKKDERVSRVFIQEGGIALINQIDSFFDEFNQTMFEGFSAEDLNILRDFLLLIKNNLQSSETLARQDKNK